MNTLFIIISIISSLLLSLLYFTQEEKDIKVFMAAIGITLINILLLT